MKSQPFEYKTLEKVSDPETEKSKSVQIILVHAKGGPCSRVCTRKNSKFSPAPFDRQQMLTPNVNLTFSFFKQKNPPHGGGVKNVEFFRSKFSPFQTILTTFSFFQKKKKIPPPL